MGTIVDWLKTSKLTPVQMIYIFIAIFFFVFMSTDIFESFPDIVQALLYGGIVLTGILLGVSMVNVKKLAEEMKAIYIDTDMDLEQKINAYGSLALQVLTKLGTAWDMFHDQQFDEAKKERLIEEVKKLDEKL